MTDDFATQVRQKAEAAVAERLGTATDDSESTDEATDEGLTPSAIADRGWDTSEYNSFFGDCRKAGYSASECGDAWSALKQADMISATPPAPAVDDEDADASENGSDSAADVNETGSGHILLVKEGSEASDVAVQYLGQAVAEDDLDAATVSSDEGQEMLAAVDQVPEVPAHIHRTGDGFEVRPLRDLFEEYLI